MLRKSAGSGIEGIYTSFAPREHLFCYHNFMTSPDNKQSLKHAAKAGMEHASSRNVQLALLAALGIAAASVILVNVFGGVEKFRNLIESAGVFAPLAYIGLKASTYVIAPLSGTPIKLAGGALFGFWEGFIYVMIGDTLGACLNFYIARIFRVKGITKLAGKKALKQIDETTRHVGGWKALLVARLLLSSLYDFISYAAGLSNLKFKHFFWVTVLAGIPSTLFAAFIGDSLVTNQKLIFGLMAVSAVLLLLAIFLSRGGPKRKL